MAAPDLANYIEVNERIEAFYKKYPDGSLQGDYHVAEIGDVPLLIYKARAYRTADDQRPAVGMASEPFPGKTPYTKDSELMNAETSAWGRALAALGFEVKRGIASRNEVAARQGNGSSASTEDNPSEATTKQKAFLTRLMNQGGLSDEAKKAIVLFYCGQPTLTFGGARTLIERFKDDPAAARDAVLAEMQGASDSGDEAAKAALALIPSDLPWAE